MAASTKILPFMKGKDGKLAVIQDRVRLPYDTKTYSIKPNVTKLNDGVNGEDRDRLDIVLNYYEGSFQMYLKDAQVIRDWLAAQAARDARTAPLEQEGGVRFYPNNGTRQSFILVDLILDDFDFSSNERGANQMITVNFRCGDLKEAKTL